MPMCEKCWADAYDPYSAESQVDRYNRIMEERNKAGKICTPEQQAGDWWDAEKQIDKRLMNEV